MLSKIIPMRMQCVPQEISEPAESLQNGDEYMMSIKNIDELNEKIMTTDNMYQFDDITEDDFRLLSDEAKEKLDPNYDH